MKKSKALLAILLVALFVFFAVASGGVKKEEVVIDVVESLEAHDVIYVEDFSYMTPEEIEEWAFHNDVECVIEYQESDDFAEGELISQSVEPYEEIETGDVITIVISKGKPVSMEYKNALAKAETYSEYLNMSKQGIYDQLVSEYGEGFSEDAAQYAIDNLDADYKYNALKKAEVYQNELQMSKSAIYDQLISEYGEKFTEEEAQYAIDNLPD